MTKKKQKATYTYPELLEKYFPGDTLEMDEDADEEAYLTRDTFYDILERVSRPNQPSKDKD